MHTVTFIIGDQGSGKTTLAVDLSKNKKTVFLWARNFYPFEGVTNETELLIIEEANDSVMNYFINTNAINVQKSKRSYFSRPMPDVIITSNYLKENNIPKGDNIKIIVCKKK